MIKFYILPLHHMLKYYRMVFSVTFGLIEVFQNKKLKKRYSIVFSDQTLHLNLVAYKRDPTISLNLPLIYGLRQT